MRTEIMYGYIYKTTNLVNGMIYIGRHMAEAFEPEKYIGSGTVLKRAINKYGVENFKCELIETADTKEDLNKKERYWIAKYRKESPELLYNITAGGEAVMEGLRKIEFGDEIKLVEVSKVQEYLEAGWKLSALEYVKRYRKQWKKDHPERVMAAKLASQKRHPEKNRARLQKYYASEYGKAKQNERCKKYYQEHKDKCSKISSEYRKKHRAEINAYHRE